MKCGDIKKLFPDYLMMEADEETKKRVEDHISDCSSCREELESSSEMWMKLEVLPTEFPGENLKKNFYEMLDAEIEREKDRVEHKGFINGILNYIFFQKRLFSPAALIMIVLSGFLLGMFISSGKSVGMNNGSVFPEENKTVHIMTSGQEGILKILNAYEDLRTGSWAEPETHHGKKDPAEMNMFEFFAEAAFNFTEYFEKIITL